MIAPSWFDWYGRIVTPHSLGPLADEVFDVGERLSAVNLGQALAENVEIGA